MAEYSSKTISELIKEVDEHKTLLPSIQRNFVWSYEKICELFDSVMRDYPIGTFLFWPVDGSVLNEFVFNSFVDHIDEYEGGLLRGDRVSGVFGSFDGVLDGQQRITSLYLGLKGYINVRLKGKKIADPASYQKRYLCIDVLHLPVGNDDQYHFAFLPEERIAVLLNDYDEGSSSDRFWVKVSDASSADFSASDLIENIENSFYDGSMPQALRKTVERVVDTLKAAVNFKNNINFYSAKNKDLRSVVDIFVRVNSGGQKLSASDLMLSIAAGENNEDIHVLLSSAVDEINEIPNTDWTTKVDKELLLTAGLMFTGAESLSLQKKENYSRDSLNKVFGNWERIVDSLKYAVSFIDYLGFTHNSLTSKNLILPVAYHFYKNPDYSCTHKNSTSPTAIKDKIFIRQWLFRAMVNSIFRDGTGSTLLRIKNIIDVYDDGVFPLKQLMEARSKRNLNITDDRIEELLNETIYTSPLARPLLASVRPSTGEGSMDVDHIWPKSAMSTKKALKKRLPSSSDSEISFYKDNFNGILNLQLLNSMENNEKNDRLFHEWVQVVHPDPGDYYYSYSCIPQDGSYQFHDFRAFIEARRKLLRTALREKLPEEYEDILAQFGLVD